MLCHFIFIPLNPPDADVHWGPVKHTWKPFKNPQMILPLFRRAHIQALSPWGGGNRIPSPGDHFYCFPGTSQNACCSLVQSRQGSCFVYCVFSCNWQVKLSLSQVQKRNTEKLLYLVSRPSLSGAGGRQAENTEEMQHQAMKQQAPSSK